MTILGCFQFQEVYISRSSDIQPATALGLFSLQKLGAETEHFENFEQRSVNWDTSWFISRILVRYNDYWGSKNQQYMVETIIYNYKKIIIEKTLGNSLQCHQTWLDNSPFTSMICAACSISIRAFPLLRSSGLWSWGCPIKAEKNTALVGRGMSFFKALLQA